MIMQADARALPLRDESVQCCVTSPPYWGLRDYGTAQQIGLEVTPDAYVSELVTVFQEVRRVLKPDGVCWMNLGDCYANDGKFGGETGGKQAYLLDADRKRCGREKRVTGLKPKELIGIPWRVAFALQADGWWLRQDIIWSKPNPMPESVRDRCTKAHEYVFLLTKAERYYWDAEAMREPASDRGRVNGRGGRVENPSDDSPTRWNGGRSVASFGAAWTGGLQTPGACATICTRTACCATQPRCVYARRRHGNGGHQGAHRGAHGDGRPAMSVGGRVVEVVAVRPDKVWVSTDDAKWPRPPNHCAVYVDPKGHTIRPGDSLWWQAGVAYWTPSDRPFGAFDIPLRKLGYSGVARPSGDHDE